MAEKNNHVDVQVSAKKVDPNLKKKQTLIVILLVGLLVAVLTQPDDFAVEENTAGQAELVDPPISADEELQEEAVVTKRRLVWLTQSHSLSRIELESIADRSLFADEWIEPQEQIVSKTRRVHAVYGSGDDHAALLGTTILRSGEALPEGGRILFVNSDGVHVSP